MLIVAGDNPDRIHCEPAFARLGGVAPVPASPGRPPPHRPNRGGHCQANAALSGSSSCACTTTNRPRPKSPAAPQKARPKPRTSAPSSASWLANSSPLCAPCASPHDAPPRPLDGSIGNNALWRPSTASTRLGGICTTVFHDGPHTRLANVENATAGWVNSDNQIRHHGPLGNVPGRARTRPLRCPQHRAAAGVRAAMNLRRFIVTHGDGTREPPWLRSSGGACHSCPLGEVDGGRAGQAAVTIASNSARSQCGSE